MLDGVFFLFPTSQITVSFLELGSFTIHTGRTPDKTDKFKLYVFFPLMHAISALMFFRECHILGNVGNEEDIDGQVQIQV